MSEDDASRDLAAELDVTLKKVEALERRLERWESYVDSVQRQQIEFQSSFVFRSKFRPLLSKYSQYPEREVGVPRHYIDTPVARNGPRIAIVTPSLNQGRYLRATIDSVLSQTYRNFSYVVQDGGSRDDSLDVLKSYAEQLKWRSEPDSGQADAINRGFAGADGEVMAYLNSDDTLLPGTLAYVARAFIDRPDVDLVYGHRVVIEREGYEIGRWVLPPHDYELTKWVDFIPQETLFWRRRVWDAIGPFDESFQFALDWDFILRAQAAGFKFKRLPRFLACFRVHDMQKTSAQSNVGDEECKRLRQQHLGFIPSTVQIRNHPRYHRFMRHHVMCHRLYKLGLFKY